jgi:hypothetical protein
MLPKNPVILLSVINTKLRDFYDSLDSLCDDLDESKEEIEKILLGYGYIYDPSLNQFIMK